MFFLKEYFWVGAILAFWSCFSALLEDLMSRWFVDPILSRFRCSIVNTVLLVVFACIVLCFFCRCYKKRIRIGKRILGVSVIILFLWGMYRFSPMCTEIFDIYSISYISSICYIDIMAFVSVCCIVLVTIIPTRKIGYNKDNGFITDTPIDKEGEDALNRWDIAKYLTDKTFNTDTEDMAFALGIVGHWGDGKSSFMSLMKKHIANKSCKDVIVMDFNPWLYEKGVNLTQVFFNELRYVLSPLSWGFSRKIKQYSDTLTQMPSPWSRFVSAFFVDNACKDERNQYEELCRRIKGLGKRIVIFVDDIDRLEREEMTAVFRLIRNASNFPHMYFVVAYDKKYVVDTLQGIFGNHSVVYTEKILQEEYILPKITEQQIRKLLFNYLGADFDINNLSIQLSKYLLNYRDVKRFLNVLMFSYGRKKGKVEKIDLILYTLLEFRYPQVSQLIMDNLDSVLLKDGYKVRYLLEDGYEKAADEALSYMDLTEYIRNTDHQEELGLEEKEIPLVVRLVFSLWRQGRRSTVRSINYQDNISLYSS